MRKRISRLLGLSAVALAFVVGACSDTDPVQPLAPSVTWHSLSIEDDLAAIENGQEIERASYHEKVIGPEGGSMYVDLHHLYVPQGAVSGPTKFTIKLMDDHSVGVELNATSVDSAGNPTGPTNNVGSAGFKQNVYLTFSYEHAYNVPVDPYSIKVVEIKDGEMIPQPTYIYPEYEAARGALSHFSDYGLAWPSRSTTYSY
jgi:hypothetical protein